MLGKLKSGEIWFKTRLGKQFMRACLQNNLSKMDWRGGSSSTAPIPQKKKKKELELGVTFHTCNHGSRRQRIKSSRPGQHW
jgi:hypothetical protein